MNARQRRTLRRWRDRVTAEIVAFAAPAPTWSSGLTWSVPEVA